MTIKRQKKTTSLMIMLTGIMVIVSSLLGNIKLGYAFLYLGGILLLISVFENLQEYHNGNNK